MFRLNGPIGAAFTHDLTDVANTKTALQGLGHFKTPDYGLTPYPDQPLFDGIKSFQKARGLTVDGIMKPGGETETAMVQEIGESGNSVLNWPKDGELLKEPPKTPPVRWPDDDVPSGGITAKPMPVVHPDAPFQAAPWWTSRPPVGAAAQSANADTARHLGAMADDGDLPDLYAASIRTDGPKAVNEFGDLLRKVADRDPQRAQALAGKVADRLGNDAAAHFGSGEAPADQPPRAGTIDEAMVRKKPGKLIHQRDPIEGPGAGSVAPGPRSPKPQTSSGPDQSVFGGDAKKLDGFKQWWNKQGKSRAQDLDQSRGKPAPADSYIWQNLKRGRKPGKGAGRPVRSNGLKGRKARNYQWDHKSGEIEVFDHNDRHIGAMDPMTGKMKPKPAKPRRGLDSSEINDPSGTPFV